MGKRADHRCNGDVADDLRAEGEGGLDRIVAACAHAGEEQARVWVRGEERSRSVEYVVESGRVRELGRLAVRDAHDHG